MSELKSISAMPEKKIEVTTSRQFASWLASKRCSLVFTTYQVGKIFMVGLSADGKVHITERTFPRCMGLGITDNGFWMSSIFQLWRFENSLLKGQRFKDYDKVFIPQVAYTTGDLDIHDIDVDPDGTPFFVNTLFSCIATISETHSFKPLWKPPFISKLLPEDRCHLNGMATENGRPKYVTMVGKSDVADGWREHRSDGGLLIEVETNEVVCDGLSMPHSPRLHEGKLYMLEAGTGYFGAVDLAKGKFERICFCPGFLRGLDFIDGYAIVGTSAIRENRTFEGLELDENLKKVGAEARCALHIINLGTGAIEHWVRAEGIIQELYDIKVLPNVQKPLLIGTQKEDIRTMLSIEENRSRKGPTYEKQAD